MNSDYSHDSQAKIAVDKAATSAEAHQVQGTRLVCSYDTLSGGE